MKHKINTRNNTLIEKSNNLSDSSNKNDLSSSNCTTKKVDKWTKVEDQKLIKLVKTYKKDWKRVSEELHTRTPVQCLHRWTKILKPGLKKGTWSIEEDRKLLEWIQTEGPCKWSQCADYIKGRTGKQVRERWFNTLNPNVVKGNWSPEEDELIFRTFASVGSKWSKMAAALPGRTENSIKNRFYSTLRRIEGEMLKSNKAPNIGANNTACVYSKKCTSLNSLLKYFAVAYEEKTRHNLLISDQSNQLLGHKSQRSDSKVEGRSSDSSNISKDVNSYNYNVNRNYDINQMNYIIDNYNLTDVNIDDTKIKDIECRINNFIKDYKDLNSSNALVELEKNENVIGNFINQLDELETILKKAKSEISQVDKAETNNFQQGSLQDDFLFAKEFDLSYPFVIKDESYMGINLSQNFNLDSVEDFYKF